MNIYLPTDVSCIISALAQKGFEAYAVGGCVRDSILGRAPDDWDITTSALPEQVKSLFPRTIDTGIQHGTVTVMIGRTGYEVTTYRIDGKYSDSRHPDSVKFTRSLEEDLKRRDFTINAMAFSCENGLVDLFGGMDDLDSHMIRCVGNPTDRFSEDALRILRAVRFGAQLDFDIDPATAEAAASLSERLSDVSAERIHTELNKLLLSFHPERLFALHELGIDAVILPELKAYFDGCSKEELLSSLSRSVADRSVRWALMLLRTGNHNAIMRRLKFDNATITAVDRLISFSGTSLTVTDDTRMRRIMQAAGADNMPMIFAFRQALEPDTDFSSAIKRFESILARGECTRLKDLEINGKDLIELGIKDGKTIGSVLDMLLERVIEDPSLNSREQLLSFASDFSERSPA